MKVEARLARDDQTGVEAVVLVRDGEIVLAPMDALIARELARELESRSASLIARQRHRARVQHA